MTSFCRSGQRGSWQRGWGNRTARSAVGAGRKLAGGRGNGRVGSLVRRGKEGLHRAHAVPPALQRTLPRSATRCYLTQLPPLTSSTAICCATSLSSAVASTNCRLRSLQGRGGGRRWRDDCRAAVPVCVTQYLEAAAQSRHRQAAAALYARLWRCLLHPSSTPPRAGGGAALCLPPAAPYPAGRHQSFLPRDWWRTAALL